MNSPGYQRRLQESRQQLPQSGAATAVVVRKKSHHHRHWCADRTGCAASRMAMRKIRHLFADCWCLRGCRKPNSIVDGRHRSPFWLHSCPCASRVERAVAGRRKISAQVPDL